MDKSIAYITERDNIQIFNKSGHFIWSTAGVCESYTQSSATIRVAGRRDVYRFSPTGVHNLISSDNV